MVLPDIKLGDHMTYGNLSFEKDERPSSDGYLIQALGKLGYATVQEEGPHSIWYNGDKLDYAHSRTVHLAGRARYVKDSSYDKDYSSGFHCFPPPDFDLCNLPAFLKEDESKFTVTGIV